MKEAKLDPKRCCEMVRVAGLRWPVYNQCRHKIKVTRDGNGYCAVHDPLEVKKRQDLRLDKYRKQDSAMRRGFDCQRACAGMKNPVKEVKALQALHKYALSLDDAWGWVTIVHADDKFTKARAGVAAALARLVEIQKRSQE